jgi:hypothetical protein
MSLWLSSGLVQYLCFAILGGLTARHISDDPKMIAGGVFAGIIFSIFSSFAGAGFLHVTSPQVRKQQGFAGAWQSFNTGFMMLIPFTVLALIAELALGWNAVQVFASAGIMTAGATMGVELAKLGKRGFIAGLLPTGAAFFLSASWMGLSILARAVLV